MTTSIEGAMTDRRTNKAGPARGPILSRFGLVRPCHEDYTEIDQK